MVMENIENNIYALQLRDCIPSFLTSFDNRIGLFAYLSLNQAPAAIVHISG